MAKRICKVCQKSYDFCPVCDDKPYWTIMFHDENCKQIFDILQKHFLKEYSDRVAVIKLKKCDLSQINSFDSAIQKQINDLLAKQVKKTIVNNKQENC